MKKSLLSILILALTTGLLLGVGAYGAKITEEEKEELQNSIQEKQQQIKDAENEKKKIQSQLSDVKNKVAQLKGAKKNLEDYVKQLDGELSVVQGKITELRGLISEKEREIEETEADLERAKEIRDDQYESMKKRIKFMYESGDTFYVELLFSAGTFSDMLNRADYVEKVSAYDNKKFQEFKTTCEYIEICKEELEADKALLDAAKAKVDEQEEDLQTLISAKETEIKSATANISAQEQAVREIEEDLEAQTAVIVALEKAVAAEKQRLGEGSRLTYDGGVFKFPAPSYTKITDDYGYRIHPITKTQQFHSGVDIAAPGGSPILAAYDGEVVASDYNSSMGNYIMIDHGDGLYTIYMHASALYASTGKYVARGEKIAAVGTTGRSTGNHLHFGVRLNGAYVSPWKYLGN